MRLVSVKGPEGVAAELVKLAFAAGIDRVTTRRVTVQDSDNREKIRDVIDVDTSTPKAKAFIESVTQSAFFDSREFSIAVRQPRSIVGGGEVSALTRPLTEPEIDLFEELWQFSHVTFGFVGRLLIAGMLLAYGIIEFKLLFIIAGLLFIPLLPPMLAMGFGIWTRQFRLAAQGLLALVMALSLLAGGGVIVALLTHPPMQYTESNSIGAGFLVSFVVGVAAALATVDDVGRRELIGLAASSQVAIIPVWFGVCLVFGFPAAENLPPAKRFISLVLNVVAIALASLITYAAVRMKWSALAPLTRR
jgi:hypothetical protein